MAHSRSSLPDRPVHLTLDTEPAMLGTVQLPPQTIGDSFIPSGTVGVLGSGALIHHNPLLRVERSRSRERSVAKRNWAVFLSGAAIVDLGHAAQMPVWTPTKKVGTHNNRLG